MTHPRPACAPSHFADLPLVKTESATYRAGTTTPLPAFDPVSRPAHYASGPIECADAIEVAIAGQPPHIGWCLGNAIKYLWRAGQKDDAAQDLRKAVWYIERAILRLEATR